MSVLKVYTFPDPVLLKKAEPIKVFNAKLQTLVEDMIETMRAENGIGLAAPQVGISQRLIVLEVPEHDEDDSPMTQFAVCNPVIVKKEGFAMIEEGCLSLPDFFVEVERAEKIVLEGQNPHGKKISIEADGLLAICFQHEIDHLNGKLLVNYVDKNEREEYREEMKLRKQKEA